MSQCGCETGGDCTKTTMCALEIVTEDLENRIEALTEALQALLDACNGRHGVDFETSLAMEWADDTLKEYKG